MAALHLGLLLFSFIITSILVIPFIDLLYKAHFLRQFQKTLDFQEKRTPIFDKFHKQKAGTPVGGGLLIILVVITLYLIILPALKIANIPISANYPINKELFIVFFVFICFGVLGLYDDVLKFFGFKKTGFFGLRMRYKFTLQWIIALVASVLIYFNLGLNFTYLPLLGPVRLGLASIPFFATLIVTFANAYNITDGLDGLAGGLLMIYLFAFWVMSNTSLDTPIAIFLALWIGTLIAFLYFNVHPARVMLGDVGALSFGATLATIAILLGKIVPLIIIGFFFLAEMLSSLIQILSKKYLGRKVFPAAPLHLTLQKRGWEEPKIVMRAWLSGIILAVFGLWLAFL
jgi:phospho-N-acetylmuramoyl-pentapeptide-transferase